MTSIIGTDYTVRQYIDLVVTLKQVCSESNLTLRNNNKVQQLQRLWESPDLDALDGYNIGQLVKQITQFTSKNLILYEAAKRNSMYDLSKWFLERWSIKQNQRFTCLFGSEIYGFFSLLNQSGCAFPTSSTLLQAPIDQHIPLHERLQHIKSKIFWPKFQSSSSELEIMRSLKHILAKDMVFEVFHEKEKLVDVPYHISHFITNNELNTYQNYLVEKYAHLKQTLTIVGKDRLNITDQKIAMLLHRFKNLITVNLSFCTRLTKACLSRGHSTINEINLIGTTIIPDNIDLTKFSKNLTIIQDNDVGVFNLHLCYNHLSWSEIENSIDTSQKIIIDIAAIGYLLKTFSDSHRIDNLSLLITLLKQITKCETVGNDRNVFHEDILRCIVDKWHAVSYFERTISEALIDLGDYYQNSTNQIEYLCFVYVIKILSAELALCKCSDEFIPGQEDLIYTLQPKDLERIRGLLAYLPAIKWLPYQMIIENINSQMQQLEDKLSTKETYETSVDQIVSKINLLNEINFEMHLAAHQQVDTACYAIQRAYYPGIVEHSVVFAFVFKIQNSRSLALRTILQKFYHYKSIDQYYSLAKLVLGTMTESDIPLSDRANNRLKCAVLTYKGLFNEKLIDKNLKDDYWNAIIIGKFGGTNKLVIDALVSFYNKNCMSNGWMDVWQPRIFEAFQLIQKRNSNFTDTSNIAEVKAYAEQQLIALWEQ